MDKNMEYLIILGVGVMGILLYIGAVSMMVYFESYTKCTEYTGILKSIDNDASKTTLQFEDGLVVNFKYRFNKPLYIGEAFTFEQCINRRGSTIYRVDGYSV